MKNDLPDFSGKTLWVVDDQLIYAKQMVELLEFCGASVKTFSDPYRVADKLKDISDCYIKENLPDLIITDWSFGEKKTSSIPYRHDYSHLPIEDRPRIFVEDINPTEGVNSEGGKVIVDAVKHYTKSLPVIITTGDKNMEFKKFLEADVSILMKAYDGDDLLQLVQSKLNREITAHNL